MHVNLFDRPRLVVDLLCLESGQEESRAGFERSDSLLVLMEGEGRLRAGPQIESLQEMDAVLVPPGQEYTVTNTGAGQLMALVMVTPKPTRASEVRVPGDTRPFRSVRPELDEPTGIARRTPPRRPPGYEGPRREMPGARQGRPFRPAQPPERGADDRRPAGERRGTTGGRNARRDDGEGPVWYPKPKPAWRPRGAPPAARGAPVGPRRNQGAGYRARTSEEGAEGGASRGARGTGPGRAGGRPAYGAGPGPRGRSSGSVSRGTRAGGASRGGPRSEKKTGDARRASRGQGPLSGRRGPGRSGPRT